MSVAAFVPRTHGAQRAGLVVVIGLHALIGAALLHGLVRTVMAPTPPPFVVKPLVDIDKPPPLPPTALPTPNRVALPNVPVPLPDDPIVNPTPQAPTITTTREAPISAGTTAGDPAGTAPTATPVPPRVATRPVIFDLQSCAPTGDDYPGPSRKAGAAGTTRLRFTVSAAGTLTGSEIVRSAGPSREHKLLDRVAQGRLAACSFGAGVDESGRAIGGTFDVDYVWKLDN